MHFPCVKKLPWLKKVKKKTTATHFNILKPFKRRRGNCSSRGWVGCPMTQRLAVQIPPWFQPVIVSLGDTLDLYCLVWMWVDVGRWSEGLLAETGCHSSVSLCHVSSQYQIWLVHEYVIDGRSYHVPQFTPLMPDENREVLVTVCSWAAFVLQSQSTFTVMCQSKRPAVANMQEHWVRAAGWIVNYGTVFWMWLSVILLGQQ